MNASPRILTDMKVAAFISNVEHSSKIPNGMIYYLKIHHYRYMYYIYNNKIFFMCSKVTINDFRLLISNNINT